MKHLEDEDIGRLIDKNVTKQERKQFLKHLSQCKTCLTLYNETLKFMGEEKSKSLLTFPIPKKITVGGLWRAINAVFTVKGYRWAFAAMFIIIIIMPFVVKEFSQAGIKNAQIQYIEKRVEGIGSSAFFPSCGETFAAFRAGIFVEDLSILVQSHSKEELRLKISRMLDLELKRLSDEKHPLLQELAHLDKNNLAAKVQRTRELMEKHPFSGLFRLGQFVEQSINGTFANKIPRQEDIQRYRQIAQSYQLPPGIIKQLNKLKTTTGYKECREIFKEIEGIFFK